MDWDYELLVIGAGSGGLAAAETAANYGVRVAIAAGRAVADTEFGDHPRIVDYDYVPLQVT